MEFKQASQIINSIELIILGYEKATKEIKHAISINSYLWHIANNL